jgi:hypothetical protein
MYIFVPWTFERSCSRKHGQFWDKLLIRGLPGWKSNIPRGNPLWGSNTTLFLPNLAWNEVNPSAETAWVKRNCSIFPVLKTVLVLKEVTVQVPQARYCKPGTASHNHSAIWIFSCLLELRRKFCFRHWNGLRQKRIFWVFWHLRMSGRQSIKP